MNFRDARPLFDAVIFIFGHSIMSMYGCLMIGSMTDTDIVGNGAKFSN